MNSDKQTIAMIASKDRTFIAIIQLKNNLFEKPD